MLSTPVTSRATLFGYILCTPYLFREGTIDSRILQVHSRKHLNQQLHHILHRFNYFISVNATTSKQLINNNVCCILCQRTLTTSKPLRVNELSRSGKETMVRHFDHESLHQLQTLPHLFKTIIEDFSLDALFAIKTE